MRSNTRSRRTFRALPALLAVAGLALGACGGDDETTDEPVPAATDAPADEPSGDSNDDPITDPAVDVPTGDASLDACSLLDLVAVEGLLGTPGVTASTDTSLGAADGCRYASARTDVPALIVGNGAGIDFETTLRLACGDETPIEVPEAGAGAVECFGALLVPTAVGSLLVSVEDPTDALTDDQERAVAVAGATVAAGRLG